MEKPKKENSFPISCEQSPNAHLKMKKINEENFSFISFVTDNESNFYCVYG